MSEHSSPRPSAVEVVLFAPIGAALALRDNAPQWASQGRARVETRIRVAKMIGEFAVRTGIKELERRVAGRFPSRDTSSSSDAETQTASNHVETSDAGASTTSSASAPAPVDSLLPGPLVSSLPIPSYDSLAASQVVERLEGLSSEELESVRAYELAGRHRQTVLHRIDQLRES